VRGGKAHSPTLRCVTEGCGWERPLTDEEQLEAMRLGDLRDGEAAAAS
jgi:hypothetical protein